MPDPNNIIMPEIKVIGMLIPKVANEAMKYALIQLLEIDKNIHPSRAFETCNKKVETYNFWVFSFVRNPFDRLVSCWAQKTQCSKDRFHRAFGRFGIYPKISFENFVKIIINIPDEKSDQHWRSQTHEIMIGDRIIPDFVGRFENIEEDWKVVQQKIPGLPILPHINRCKHKPYRKYYSPKLRDQVAERYKRDIEVLGYDF